MYNAILIADNDSHRLIPTLVSKFENPSHINDIKIVILYIYNHRLYMTNGIYCIVSRAVAAMLFYSSSRDNPIIQSNVLVITHGNPSSNEETEAVQLVF